MVACLLCLLRCRRLTVAVAPAGLKPTNAGWDSWPALAVSNVGSPFARTFPEGVTNMLRLPFQASAPASDGRQLLHRIATSFIVPVWALLSILIGRIGVAAENPQRPNVV